MCEERSDLEKWRKVEREERQRKVEKGRKRRATEKSEERQEERTATK